MADTSRSECALALLGDDKKIDISVQGPWCFPKLWALL